MSNTNDGGVGQPLSRPAMEAPLSLQGSTAGVTAQPPSPPRRGRRGAGGRSHRGHSGPASGISGAKNQPRGQEPPGFVL